MAYRAPSYLLLLLLSLFSVSVTGSPVGLDGIFDDYHSFNSTKKYHEIVDTAATPLVRIDHHHVGKRDFHHELFEPQSEVVLDWQFRKPSRLRLP
jgi:hypothetical protein